ncbi:MAG TPA: hypothetical protein IAA29_00660 [Candidatus Paenibacillus intestinavium]|nr:hypothetical protein [Candidatus Paenibacillus intestinavium]
MANENQVNYQLYKLLAYAIQELDWFTSQQNVSDTLALPHPDRVIINRAEIAVKRIMEQDPRFFAGYAKYSKGWSVDGTSKET